MKEIPQMKKPSPDRLVVLPVKHRTTPGGYYHRTREWVEPKGIFHETYGLVYRSEAYPLCLGINGGPLEDSVLVKASTATKLAKPCANCAKIRK